ncbi:MAG: hypothetical protein V3T58_03080 [Candidatus Hydrothermarchaeales archaeon]
MVEGFLGEDRGQAASLDLLIFALLISISSGMIVTYGLGAYHADLHMRAVQTRYAVEFANSFALTARYISGGRGSPSAQYIIGPASTCTSSEGKEVMYLLSKVIESSPLGSSPLNREVRGSPIDMIADDVFLSLGIHVNGEEYPLSKLMTGCYHRSVAETLKDTFDFLSGGTFEYRLEASWHPFENSKIKDVLYSQVSYGSPDIPDSSVYVVKFQIAVPADERALSKIGITAERFFENFGEISSIIPAPEAAKRKRLSKVFASLQLPEANSPVNDRAEITLSLWPNVGG